MRRTLIVYVLPAAFAALVALAIEAALREISPLPGWGQSVLVVLSAAGVLLVMFGIDEGRTSTIGIGVAIPVGAWLIALVLVLWPEPEDSCGRTTSSDALDVMVVWDDEAELDAFCQTVAAYDPEVSVTSVGENIGGELSPRFEDGTAPDVAIIPQPSLVRRYASAGRLCATEDEVADRFPDGWNEFVRERVDGSGPIRTFGAFVKGANKSLFWYDDGAMEDDVVPELWSWEQMFGWLEQRAESDLDGAPLALPAEQRWPVTDWFEAQLANADPDLYRALGDGTLDWDDTVRPRLEPVLETMADVWNIPGIFPASVNGEGTSPPAETTWQEAAEQLTNGTAAIAFGPSFMAGPVDENNSANVHPIGFPGAEPVAQPPEGQLPYIWGGGRSIIVGGDAAVVPRPASGCDGGAVAARHFVNWLTNEDAMETWSESDPGFLTPNELSPHLQPGAAGEGAAVRHLLTRTITESPNLFFDLSDNQFARADDSEDPEEARGTWELFARFFHDATEGDPDAAIQCAITRLEAEYDGRDWPEPCAR